MAVHRAGIAAVFREDKGALFSTHPQGAEIIMCAFYIAAALVKPAAGVIYEAARVCKMDLFCQAQGIELSLWNAYHKI